MKQAIGKPDAGVRVNLHTSVEETNLILKHFWDNKMDREFTWLTTHTVLDLRQCESTRIQLKDLAKDLSSVMIRRAKTDHVDQVYVPEHLRKILYQYIESHYHEIRSHRDYLFYSNNPANKTGYMTATAWWNILRKAKDAVGIKDKLPTLRKDGKARYRVGSHSFRRLATTELVKQTDSIIFTAFYRGDTDERQVMRYTDQQQFYDRIEIEAEKLMSKFIIKPKLESRTEELKVREMVKEEVARIMQRMIC